MAKIKKVFYRYLKVLTKRVYRPFKPFLSPLLKRLKISWVLGGLLILVVGGIFWQGVYKNPQETVAWWPWFSKSHSEMALAWFENGNEKKALEELMMANSLLILKTSSKIESLKKAEVKVREPERIRKEIEEYEKVLEDKPYYRDILLRLSILNYQIYENEKAVKYFKQAEYLDPLNREVVKIKEIISSLF